MRSQWDSESGKETQTRRAGKQKLLRGERISVCPGNTLLALPNFHQAGSTERNQRPVRGSETPANTRLKGHCCAWSWKCPSSSSYLFVSRSSFENQTYMGFPANCPSLRTLTAILLPALHVDGKFRTYNIIYSQPISHLERRLLGVGAFIIFMASNMLLALVK